MRLSNSTSIQDTQPLKFQSLIMFIFMFLMLSTSIASSQAAVCGHRGEPKSENCVCAKGARSAELDAWDGKTKFTICLCPNDWMEVVNGSCACPKGTTLRNGSCACNNQGETLDHTGCNCPSGQIVKNRRCTPSSTRPLCPQGTSLLGGRCTKLGTCPAGYTMRKNRLGWACQASPLCPTGTRALGVFCVANETPVACPPGSVLKNRTCVVEACPEGTNASSGGYCIPRDIAAKTPVCPPNSEKDRSRAECYVSPTCSGETKLITRVSGGVRGSRCTMNGTPTCPEGTKTVVVPKGGGVRCLLDAPPTCPTGSVLVGNVCSIPMVCPSGSTLVNGQCDVGNGCPSGSTNFVEFCATSQPNNNCPEGGKQGVGEFLCSSEKVICPEGYSVEGVMCLTKPTCPAGRNLREGNSAFAGRMNVTCVLP